MTGKMPYSSKSWNKKIDLRALQQSDIYSKQKSETDDIIQNLIYQSNMLLTLINDLLDLAKIENQKFHINEQYFDLNKLVE